MLGGAMTPDSICCWIHSSHAVSGMSIAVPKPFGARVQFLVWWWWEGITVLGPYGPIGQEGGGVT